MRSILGDHKHIIVIFIDGIGVGESNADFNPCCHSRSGIFLPDTKVLPFNGQKFALDASLDMPGLPQSATGQTSIYTGFNAAKYIGRHLFGYPNKPLRELLQKRSLFIKLSSLGYQCKFLNAFRPIFFTTPELFKNKSMSATTEMNRAAHLPFLNFADLKKRRALYHEYTNKTLIELGFDVPYTTPEEAATVIVEESQGCDLLLYEYFLTDYAGHAQNISLAIEEIHKIEKLIYALLSLLDLNDTFLMIISDHGNVEDLRTKSHTHNPAFMALWGSDRNRTLHTILDIYPFLIDSLIQDI